MPNKYHGEYRTVEGCQKIWVSADKENLQFPPQVSYNCDWCNTTHNFRLQRTYTIATPGQARQFDEYCRRNNIEQDVDINN